jgi:hypothetical protein
LIADVQYYRLEKRLQASKQRDPCEEQEEHLNFIAELLYLSIHNSNPYGGE